MHTNLYKFKGLNSKENNYFSFFFQNLFTNYQKFIFLQPYKLSDGVTGNTTDFGSVESRFEP